MDWKCVQLISDRIILLELIIGKAVYTLISVYAPQQGRSAGRKKGRFYGQLQSVASMVPLSKVIIPLGYWNGHIGTSGGMRSASDGIRTPWRL